MDYTAPRIPSPCELSGERPGSTAVELSQLRRTWSAEFIPLPADLHVPRGGGLKSALLNSTAVLPGPLPAAQGEGIHGEVCVAHPTFSSVGLVQKQLRILRLTHPHPGPLPSDGRGRIVLRRSAYPTSLEAARDGSGCSLSRRTGEGQGRIVRNAHPGRQVFLHKP